MTILLDKGDAGKKEVAVPMGSLMVSNEAQDVLTTLLGSCVGLCLYDTKSKVAGLAHVMLPDSKGESASSIFEAKYADHALAAALRLIEAKGGRLHRLVGKIVGGARIFSGEGMAQDTAFDIGARNVAALFKLLNEYDITVVSSDTGSNQARWLWFYVATGSLVVGKRAERLTL